MGLESLLATITDRPIRGVGELASIAIAKGLSLPDRCRYMFLFQLHSLTTGNIERFDPDFFAKVATGLDLTHVNDKEAPAMFAFLEHAEVAEPVVIDCLRAIDAWLLWSALDRHREAPNSAPVLH